jgi:phospholipid/cholesterol/gamma-HCH transport system substrate-binding protein
MSAFRAGLLALTLILLFSYFGFTKANPFANPYELKAVFQNVNNLKPNSPVRIAGVDVGKVKNVEPITPGDGEGAAKVTMEIKKKGLPIHEDATVKARTRIFLEGNLFLDLKPGSPSSPIAEDGFTIPMQHAAAPVQFGQVLSALQSDTREDLKTFLREYSKGLSGKGAKGFNDSIKYWPDAYKNTALANDASLGEEPTKDLQRVLKGQQRVSAALNSDENALKGLVTNFNVTAGALAREDVALEASIPALRDTLKAGMPALASLNAALPSVRAFAADALPGVRSSTPTLKAGLPFIRQARLLVRRSELRGLAAELRRQVPNLVALNRTSVPVLDQARALSACTNNVLVPFIRSPLPNVQGPDANGNANQQVRNQIQRGFVGLSGESRLSDGNNQMFHTSAVPLGQDVQPAPPPVVDQPPPRRPDVPCETQDPPNLNAPGGPTALFAGKKASTKVNVAALLKAKTLFEKADQVRVQLVRDNRDLLKRENRR